MAVVRAAILIFFLQNFYAFNVRSAAPASSGATLLFLFSRVNIDVADVNDFFFFTWLLELTLGFEVRVYIVQQD